jgi:hypothetical protein
MKGHQWEFQLKLNMYKKIFVFFIMDFTHRPFFDNRPISFPPNFGLINRTIVLDERLVKNPAYKSIHSSSIILS